MEKKIFNYITTVILCTASKSCLTWESAAVHVDVEYCFGTGKPPDPTRSALCEDVDQCLSIRLGFLEFVLPLCRGVRVARGLEERHNNEEPRPS